MSDSDHSDTLSTISTVSSLTNTDRSVSPPPYSPASPRIYADSMLSVPAEDVDETLSSTLTASSSSTTHEPSVLSSPSSSACHVSPAPSPPKRVKNPRHKAISQGYKHDHNSYSTHNNHDSNSNRSSPRARPPRTHPPHSPIASSPPPRPSNPPPRPSNPPRSPRSFPPPAPGPPPMSSNSWMHPAQGFSVHQSASPLGASQSINFHGPPMPAHRLAPLNQYPRYDMGMSGMEEMRRGMEDMRLTMQHDMEQMRNSMRQAHVEVMNSAFHTRHTSRTPRRAHNAGNSVVIGNQAYVPDGPNGNFFVNNVVGARGSGVNMVSVNGNEIQVGQNSVFWGGGGPGSYAVSVSSTGGGQAVSQTYIGSDGNRQTYNSYQGL